MLATISNWLSPEQSAEQTMLSFSKTGNTRYLTRLIDAFADDLMHYLIYQSNATLAQDISQKTWLKVIEKKHLFKREQNFKAWLFTTARHTLLDEFKQQNRLTELDDEKLQQLKHTSIEPSELLAQFELALVGLNFYQKEAFILQQEGFSVAEISQIVGCDFETTKSRLRYAKQHLKLALGEFK